MAWITIRRGTRCVSADTINEAAHERNEENRGDDPTADEDEEHARLRRRRAEESSRNGPERGESHERRGRSNARVPRHEKRFFTRK
jgi:hypothetical protein